MEPSSPIFAHVIVPTGWPSHRADFQGIARTDRQVEFTAMVIYRIQDDKIAESLGKIDFLRLMRQLRAN